MLHLHFLFPAQKDPKMPGLLRYSPLRKTGGERYPGRDANCDLAYQILVYQE